MALFDFPSSTELKQVEQELVPRLTQDRPAFQILPMVDTDASHLIWDQRDNYVGLQAVRGMNGEPTRVKHIGAKRFMMIPGVYGEYSAVDEEQLTERRRLGTFGTPIDVTELVREKQDQLLGRRLDRIEYIIWQLLLYGTFSVASGTGVLHGDTFAVQTFAATVPWTTYATATPLADLRSIKLLARGRSLDFGPRSTLYMNQGTLNALLSNTNPADIGGRRGTGLSSINGPDALNQLLLQDALPTIEVYDDGYFDATGAFNLYIPDHKAVLVGRRRDNDPIGEYRFTRNANNADMAPGPYTKVVDDEDDVPRTVVVHDGHNGGPVLYHPSAFVSLTV